MKFTGYRLAGACVAALLVGPGVAQESELEAFQRHQFAGFDGLQFRCEADPIDGLSRSLCGDAAAEMEFFAKAAGIPFVNSAFADVFAARSQASKVGIHDALTATLEIRSTVHPSTRGVYAALVLERFYTNAIEAIEQTSSGSSSRTGVLELSKLDLIATGTESALRSEIPVHLRGMVRDVVNHLMDVNFADEAIQK